MPIVTLSVKNYWIHSMKNQETIYEKPDTKTYLRELIDQYDHLLLNNHMKIWHNLIREEKFKCSNHLFKIKEQDIEVQLWAKGSASPFQDMNCT